MYVPANKGVKAPESGSVEDINVECDVFGGVVE